MRTGAKTAAGAAQQPADRVLVATIGTAALVVGVLVLVPGLRPPGLGGPERAVLAAAIVASGLVDAGCMFVLGCSRFRLHAAVTVATAWSYALTIAVASLWRS